MPKQQTMMDSNRITVAMIFLKAFITLDKKHSNETYSAKEFYNRLNKRAITGVNFKEEETEEILEKMSVSRILHKIEDSSIVKYKLSPFLKEPSVNLVDV